MQIKAYLPSAKFIIGVVIVLVLVSLVLRTFSDNKYVQQARGYIGLYPS